MSTPLEIAWREARVTRDGRPVLDLSLAVPPGEFLVVLGRSGSGKSTALKTVNRLVEIEGGTLEVQGRPVGDWDPIRLRRAVGYVIQEVGLFPHFSVARNIGLVPTLLGWPPAAVADRTRELLTLVGLEAGRFAARLPHQLSGGERQRVGVARALAARPGVLLMDEPFGALDPVTRDELQGEMERLHRRLGTTIVLVTHDVREAVRLGQRIAVLADGRVAAVGTAAALEAASHPEVQRLLRLARPPAGPGDGLIMKAPPHPTPDDVS